jgi:transposase
VLAAIRQLHRLECVDETLQQGLEALAVVAPEWLRQQVDEDWFERYGSRIAAYRLPNDKPQPQPLALTIGRDGHQLLAQIYAPAAPAGLAQLAAVETLRQVWVQQYWVEANQVNQRSAENRPPYAQLIQSPYDLAARNRTKRDPNWTGYAVQLTATGDPDWPNLIIHVDTTPATTADGHRLLTIQPALQAKDLAPAEHFVDTSDVGRIHEFGEASKENKSSNSPLTQAKRKCKR